jgi:tol-pal system protein YbgF
LKLGAFRLAAVVAVVVLTGCYGKQMVKGPIYTEQIYEKVDSLHGEQQKTQQSIQDLRAQLEEEREARIRYEAQMGLALKEMEESIRILLSRLEDQANRRSSGAESRPSYLLPIPVGASTGGSDSSAVVSDPANTAAASAVAAELYQTSYMDLTRGNYSLAIQGFQNYLVRYPTGSQLPEVHYYLGECYYASDRQLEAVGEFQYVVREFPESRLVPASFLKSGLCYLVLEEPNLAQKNFDELIEKHPDTEEAKQARDELNRLQG